MKLLIVSCALLFPSLAGAAPFEGLYHAPLAPENERRVERGFLVATADGVWVIDRAGAALVKREALPLVPPAGKGKPWQLTRGKQRWTQLADPFLARVMDGLKGRHVLNLIDLSTGRPRPDTLTLDDGVFLRLESPQPERGQPACVAGIFVHDPTENGEHALDPAPKQPATGQLGMRLYLGLELESEACATALDKTKPNLPHGLIAGARVFARSDGQLQGVQLIGYMYSALYVPAGAPPEALQKMLRSVADEIGHQAE